MSGTFNREALPDWLAYADTHGIKVEGRGTWRSILCDFHSDTHASLRINTKSGGWCCMSCGASGGDVLAHHMQRTGLDFIEAAKALGAWQNTGTSTGRERPRTLPARDALELLHADALVMFVVASDIGSGITPDEDDRASIAAIARRVLVVFEGVTA
jgi:hypothetical protein